MRVAQFSFVDAAAKQRKRRKVATKKWRTTGLAPQEISEDVWLRVLLAQGDIAPGALVVLSGVNRTLHALIRDNHALMRHLYVHSFGWSTHAHTNISHFRTAVSLAPNYITSWRPQEAWRSAGVPREQRALFDAHVWRLCVLRFAPWCSVCHVVHNVPSVTPIWALGLRVCEHCMPECFISHRALWHRYRINLNAPLPEAMQRPDRRDHEDPDTFKTLMDKAVFTVVDHSNGIHRSLLTRSRHDFRAVGRSRLSAAKTFFFWRPHVHRVLRLKKAEAYLPLCAQATEVIAAFARRWAVARALGKGPPSNAVNRLWKRERAVLLRDPPREHFLEDHVSSTWQMSGLNPWWTRPQDTAWGATEAAPPE